MEDKDMVSYAHQGDPKGYRFCQYKKDPLPIWAVDAQPYIPPDSELPGMWENADFTGGQTDA